MISNKNVIRLSIALGIVSWVSLLVIDLIILFGSINNIVPGIHPEIPTLLLNIFFVSVFAFYKFRIGKAESINFIDLLWRVFVTGLLTTVVSLIIQFFFYLLGSSKMAHNPLLINFFYHINLGLIAAFLISTFIVWKRLIIYQKNKHLVRTWRIFEYSLLASILFSFFHYITFDTVFNIVFAILFAMGVILSVNLKWIAYLNFKQKWKSILLLTFVIIFLCYFFINLFDYSNNYNLITDLLNNVFILALFAFIFLYSLFSLLVILFNLPTSSVFEQKLEEVLNFQRLSQSIQVGQNEDKVYNILLESSVSAVSSDAAWLEILNENGNRITLFRKDIEEAEVEEIKSSMHQSRIKNIIDKGFGRNAITNQIGSSLQNSYFKSILMIPLKVQNKSLGTLALLKEVEDGFNKEMVDIINTFANQACISIENFRLLTEALENERYKEELKIAKKVQRSLLPKELGQNPDFEISAFSEAADEVGGDYYDLYKICDHKIAIIIGDVSGKGTSAAFNMSQMKGVFHSLVQLDLSAEDFLSHANSALSRCLEKTSFITVSLFIINTVTKRIHFARAGHCPTLYYNKSKDESDFFHTKGMGLGIVRNHQFLKYVEVNEIPYHSGDIIVLYTDGITEARNGGHAEYGYERLRVFLKENAALPPPQIQKNLMEDLYSFCGKKTLNDDYTTLIIKFR